MAEEQGGDGIYSKRAISHDEAEQIARRFIGGNFENRDERGQRIHPRITIPADTERDDDVLLLSYIRQQRLRSRPGRAEALEAALLNPTEDAIDAGLAVTASYLDIKGSALTVNREKMRRRFVAMVRALLSQKQE